MSRQYDNRGRDMFNIENANNVVIQNREQPIRPRYEQLLLQQAKQEIASRLEQSLHNKVLIILDKQVQPEQVKRLWDAEVKIGSKPSEPLLPQTSTLEVFERPEIAGQLLILGAPGAGKTTTMLDLARFLVDKAIQDSSYPIPGLFNLSSWKDPRQSISVWLVEELKSKYGVRKDIGKKLIEEKQLLPLLDGLDEVKPEHQEPCVDSVNQWLQGEERPLFVVVCSRREEYASYKTRLHLNGAIVLQELTDKQIQEYLSDVKRDELWQLLQQDTVLLELVKTPLLLSIIVLSYEELSLQRWQQLTSTKQRIKMLLGAYVQTMFRREIVSRAYRKLTPPNPKQTQHWLIFLARQLQQESQTEFLIEKMQPSWLVTSKQKKAYRWTVSLIYGLGGIFVGLIGAWFIELTTGPFSYSYLGLINSLYLGLIYVLSSRLIDKQEQEIKLVEAFGWNWSFKEAKKASISGLIVGLTLGLISGLISGLFIGFALSPHNLYTEPLSELIIILTLGLIVGLIIGLTLGLIYGLILGLIYGLIGGLIGLEIDTKKTPNQGVWKSVKNALFITLFLSFILGLSSELIHNLLQETGLKVSSMLGNSMLFLMSLEPSLILITGLNWGLSWGLIGGLFSTAGKAVIRHLALRFTLHQRGFIPWNYARFLNYCTERGFLQRVGGRYRFIHKLLQDHFAEMDTDIAVRTR